MSILDKLNNREKEVALLVCSGLSNKAVSDRLFITEKTVKFHLTNIYKKLEVRSRLEMTVTVLKEYPSDYERDFLLSCIGYGQ